MAIFIIDCFARLAMTLSGHYQYNLDEMKLKAESKQFLLKLAERTISDYFAGKDKPHLRESEITDPEIIENRATFVTLTIDGKLRGCIGSLTPRNKLYEDVINNSLMAAFSDTRFSPLSEEEFEKTKIEISVLDEPKHIDHKDKKTFLDIIAKKKPGMIVQLGLNQATYLPQVWGELPDPEKFIESLCQKAGLSPDAWTRPDTEIFTYEVENFEEL